MLTAQQHKLLEFIDARVKERGVSPSFDEMKDALGLKSKSGIHRLINALEERGFIRRLANKARAIEVVRKPNQEASATVTGSVITGAFGGGGSAPLTRGVASSAAGSQTLADDSFDIPMHGRIAAGTPIEALESADHHISVPASFAGRGACYALEVSGDSMVEKGILDGDTVVIERCDTARDGEIVVALVDREEATLKSLERMGPHIALHPANRDYKTQIYDGERVTIQGRLVGLLRSYH